MAKKFKDQERTKGERKKGGKPRSHPPSFPRGWDPSSAMFEAPTALVLTDGAHRVLWWNRKAENLLKLGESGALGRPLHLVLGLHEPLLPNATSTSPGQADSIPHFEVVTTTPSGRELTLEVFRGHPSSKDRAPIQWAFVDVSWRKEIEAQIHHFASLSEMARLKSEAAQRHAEKESQAKSSFLANMSHEIRTPMTAILGFAETLQDPGLSPEEVAHAVETIHRNGDYLLGIINDILDLSKIEAGHMKLEKRAVDLRELFSDVRDLLEPRATGKGVGFRLEAPDGLPVRIQSDPLRLRQVLINLVGNAIKFTNEGEIVLRATRDPKGLLVEVIDSGIGLSPEQCKTIFEPFAQADASTTRRFGGTGLGLAICTRLCEAMGGELSVESTEGIGSVFRFVLPLDAEEDLSSKTWPPLEAVLNKNRKKPGKAPRLRGKVLLAEDGPDNLRLITYLLRKTGVEIETAENGREALEKALGAWEAGQAFDLILMDLQMPEMDGFEATQCLRDKGYTGIIVALTAHGIEEILAQATRAGCNAWVVKPIERENFFQTLASILPAR